MNIKRILFTASVLTIAGLALAALNNNSMAKGHTNTPGFAVVELFTSEGCSSCPPADEAVARLIKSSEGKPVYVLGFHVDYWNRLGWADKFSSAQYSDRQRKYADWLRLQQAYTPQVVVNGKTEFVGSEENTLRNTVNANLNKPAAGGQLSLKNGGTLNGELTLQYQTQTNTNNNSLLVAWVQKHAQTKVLRGENNGSTLNHVNIVRQLNSFGLKGQSGSVLVKIPQGFNTTEWELIAFVQNNSSGEIISAQKL